MSTTIPLPRSAVAPGRRAALLRAEFDAAFAVPVNAHTDPRIDVLTFRIGEELHAIDLMSVAEMSARPLITPVPTGVAALHGLAATHGRVVAAYDVSRLIGGPVEAPRWMVVPAAQTSVGLTFEHFEGHRLIPAGYSDVTSGRLVDLNHLLDAVRALNPGSRSPGVES